MSILFNAMVAATASIPAFQAVAPGGSTVSIPCRVELNHEWFKATDIEPDTDDDFIIKCRLRDAADMSIVDSVAAVSVSSFSGGNDKHPRYGHAVLVVPDNAAAKSYIIEFYVASDFYVTLRPGETDESRRRGKSDGRNVQAVYADLIVEPSA